ncbi:MAG TPA: polysaccharide deacetylase family protein [Candidatus Limnocylindrales bacterium]|nr:polysaccharide deacetylase family protein [Candidatus Limnocylindrales bacterium]
MIEKFNVKQTQPWISKLYGYGLVLILALVSVLYSGLLHRSDPWPDPQTPPLPPLVLSLPGLERGTGGGEEIEARGRGGPGAQRYREAKTENGSVVRQKFDVKRKNNLPFPSVPRSRPLYTDSSDSDLITFDDGPTPQTTPHILDVLDRYGVKANFFLEGERIRRYPYLAQEILRRGHQLGYHSMWHQNLVNFSREEIEQDIIEFRQVVRTYVDPHYRVTLGRPPYGGFTKETIKTYFKYRKKGILSHIPIKDLDNLVAPHIREAFRQQGLVLQLWNVDVEDWERPVNIHFAVSELLKPGQQVLLLHELPLSHRVGRHHGSDAYLKLSAILGSLHPMALK